MFLFSENEIEMREKSDESPKKGENKLHLNSISKNSQKVN